MGLRRELQRRAAQLLTDPRLFKLFQDERLVGVLAILLSLRDKLGSALDVQRQRFATLMRLPTRKQLDELERRIQALEQSCSDAEPGLGSR
jgi:hypothetical protein